MDLLHSFFANKKFMNVLPNLDLKKKKTSMIIFKLIFYILCVFFWRKIQYWKKKKKTLFWRKKLFMTLFFMNLRNHLWKITGISCQMSLFQCFIVILFIRWSISIKLIIKLKELFLCFIVAEVIWHRT